MVLSAFSNSIEKYFTRGDLEIGEVLFIIGLVVVAITLASYIRALRLQLARHKQLLDNQAKFNAKLNETVNHVLKLDSSEKIDKRRDGRSGK